MIIKFKFMGGIYEIRHDYVKRIYKDGGKVFLITVHGIVEVAESLEDALGKVNNAKYAVSADEMKNIINRYIPNHGLNEYGMLSLLEKLYYTVEPEIEEG